MSTEQKHTPEPWSVPPGAGLDDGTAAELAGANNEAIGMFFAACRRKPEPRNHADLARIVACVNYCADMTDDQLTCDSALIVREELDRVVEQRDWLLAALARLEDACSGESSDRLPYEHPARIEARAAIAKVQP